MSMPGMPIISLIGCKPISATPSATAPPTEGGWPALPAIGRDFGLSSEAMPRRSNTFAMWMPLVPPLAGSV